MAAVVSGAKRSGWVTESQLTAMREVTGESSPVIYFRSNNTVQVKKHKPIAQFIDAKYWKTLQSLSHSVYLPQGFEHSWSQNLYNLPHRYMLSFTLRFLSIFESTAYFRILSTTARRDWRREWRGDRRLFTRLKSSTISSIDKTLFVRSKPVRTQ
mmetsp:Transcript_14092/g.26081  ORF Transcript_14092/g.26081 Transcript_14092/m.26081 type:complete len:155 (-) Transcript_14092:79-543(-)